MMKPKNKTTTTNKQTKIKTETKNYTCIYKI